MKKKTITTGNITIIIFIIFIFLLPTSALAQTTSLSLWPPLLEILIKPGKVVTQVYRLTNNSGDSVQIIPQIYPFIPLGDSGQIEIIYPKPESSTIEPIFFSIQGSDQLTDSMTLKPRETRELVLKIGVPRLSTEKDYYYTLLFSTSTKDETGSNRTSSISQIGSNIIITTSETGLLDISGKITQFFTPKIIDSFSPVNFLVKIQNSGINHFKPFGKIEVTGILNQKYGIPLFEQNILSNSVRQLTINSLYPKLSIGPFKSKLTVSLNQNGPSYSSEISFWMLPYKAGILIIVIVLIIIILKRILKRRTRGA